MKSISCVLLIVVGLVASLGAQAPARPQSPSYTPRGSLQDYFVGTWRLVLTENRYADGKAEPYPEYGPKGLGYLMYDRTGHMCAQLMHPSRPKWADEDHPSPAEALSAISGFASYCGTYEIVEKEQTMVHHPETAWKPGYVGTVQRRPYHLTSQDAFYFSGTDTETRPTGEKVDVVWTISWVRVK